MEELGALQDAVQELAEHRSTALRMLITSRSSTTSRAQREFWLEFSWIDQEYRFAVCRLAEFCLQYQFRPRIAQLQPPERSS